LPREVTTHLASAKDIVCLPLRYPNEFSFQHARTCCDHGCGGSLAQLFLILQVFYESPLVPFVPVVADGRSGGQIRSVFMNAVMMELHPLFRWLGGGAPWWMACDGMQSQSLPFADLLPKMKHCHKLNNAVVKDNPVTEQASQRT